MRTSNVQLPTSNVEIQARHLPGSTILFAIVLTIISCSACFAAAGNSLDFYFGCALLAVLFCPGMIAAEPRGTWWITAVVWLVITIFWWFIGHTAGVTAGQSLMCSLLLGGVIGTCAAGTVMLIRWKIPPSLAAAIVIILQILWLTWPVWLSPSIPGIKPGWLVSLHPLLAINGVLKDLGIWTEQPLAYGLTTLGQDVEYQLPASPWPAIGANLLLGGAMVLLSQFARKKA